jgi:FtsP/CotA-like multicopper oxidase with cupredoxin domain
MVLRNCSPLSKLSFRAGSRTPTLAGTARQHGKRMREQVEWKEVSLDFDSGTNPAIRSMSVFHCHLLNHEDKSMMAKILLK